jgi:multidrug resistance efflux pump
MPHKRPPIPVIIIILILAIATGGYFGVRALLVKDNGALTASGTIEAVTVAVSPEIGGKIIAISVDEGDTVQAGAPLFRLDDTLIQAQRAVAAASLELARAAAKTADATLVTAQANFNLALDAIHAEAATTRTADWRAPALSGYTLPGGYFTRTDQLIAAQAEVESAAAARDASRAKLNGLLADPANANFVAAEQRLNMDRAALVVAQDVLTKAKLSANTELRDSAQTAYDNAKAEVEDAQSAYDDLKDGDAAKEIITARADLTAAQERYESAQDRMLALQTGENSPKLTAAQAVLAQAQAASDQAHLAVTQAEASLALLDAQIAKLTVTAPAAGVILTRTVQPGEVVPAGAAALTLGQLEDLTITVYVPEDRYGALSLGQSASVSVDSFPGETFIATIIHIADQAEFTPRNVQTVEGRSSTVFAVKLRVQDPNGKLKPGMPADVTFSEK